MKKLLLITIFILSSSILFSQIPGKKIKGPLKTRIGIEFSEGDTLHIGVGTNPNGDFRYIYQPANYLVGTPEMPFPKMLSNSEVYIIFFKEYETKRIGKKTWAVIKTGSIVNSVVELDAAIESGEIIVKGYNTKTSQPTFQLSIADELAKFKKLLDDGLISKDEFEVQKKKLLGQ